MSNIRDHEGGPIGGDLEEELRASNDALNHAYEACRMYGKAIITERTANERFERHANRAAEINEFTVKNERGLLQFATLIAHKPNWTGTVRVGGQSVKGRKRFLGEVNKAVKGSAVDKGAQVTVVVDDIDA